MLGTDGLFPDSDNTVDVCQPSTADYQQSELEATGTLKRAETRLKDLKTRAEEGLADGAELRSLPSKENQIAAQKAMLSETQAFNTHLGSVFASSGFRRKEPAGEGCCLDWALVRVDKTRMGNNNVRLGAFFHYRARLTLYTTVPRGDLPAIPAAYATMHHKHHCNVHWGTSREVGANHGPHGGQLQLHKKPRQTPK